MAPLLAKLLTVLPALVSVKEAVQKDNLKSASTILATLPAVAAMTVPDATGMAPDSIEAALTQIALGIVAVVMVFIRKKA